jgi:hypothetical protein
VRTVRHAPLACAVLAAITCGCGPSLQPVTETPFPMDDDAGAPAGRDTALGAAIARWDSTKADVTAEEAACVARGTRGALAADEMARIVGGAVAGLLGMPRFVERRVRVGLWDGDVLKVNAAESDGAGGRKIWLGEGQLDQRVAYADGGKRAEFTVRSSVENPQLVADGSSSRRRDIVLLEVAARYAYSGTEVAVLADATAQLAAVLRRENGTWRFARAVDLAGLDDTLEALCRAVTAQ